MQWIVLKKYASNQAFFSIHKSLIGQIKKEFLKYSIVNIDGFVKSQKTPSPLKGEGWGEGEEIGISTTYSSLPLIPSHEGRGKKTFYEIVIIDILLFTNAKAVPK